MNETTGQSQLEARLAKAQAWLERGKQKRALQELWFAEAQARGNADAVRRLIDFTALFEQRAEPMLRSRLADLVAALEHDAKIAHDQGAASAALCQTRVGAPDGDSGRPPGQLALSVLSSLVASAVGLALLVSASSGLMCSTIAVPSGANIETGGVIALLAGLAGLLAAIGVRNHARLLSAVLFGETATLGLAIGFVARDSATATVTQDCGFFDSNVSTSTHHVEYAYVLLGLAIAVLITQAVRGWSRSPKHAGAAAASVASAAVLVAILPAQAASGSQRNAASSPPKDVLVCRAFLAPEAFGGAQCDQDVDVGRAPIRPPEGLMCSTVLRGVQGKKIGIQAFYEGTLIRHDTVRSADRTTSPYVYFDSSWVDWIVTGGRLPIGRYSCRFLVNGKVVRTRSISVGNVPFAQHPLHYHYRLELRKAGKPLPAGPIRLRRQFTIWVSSNDLPTNIAVKFSLCVNHPHREVCDNAGYYLVGRRPVGVSWEVDRGEGSGRLYRLSVRVRGREVTHRDLRLLPASRSS
jgi:hypothetical protein